MGASGRPDLPARSRSAGWGGVGVSSFLSPLSLCSVSEPLKVSQCLGLQMPRRVRDGGGWAQLGWGPAVVCSPPSPCPRPLALGWLVLWPPCPDSGFPKASPAAPGRW